MNQEMNRTYNLKPAVFFDRDGTLIKHVPYLSAIKDIELLPHAVSIARYFQQQGYFLFVITNQSGIARGFFDENFVHQTHDHLKTLLAANGIGITQYYVCPHHPSEGVIEKYLQDCMCRKPKPGMIYKAAQEHGLDLSKSLFFGDSLCDEQAGKAAGCFTFHMPSLECLPENTYAEFFKRYC